MPDTALRLPSTQHAWRPPTGLELGWGALAVVCVAIMVASPAWETIPFHVIWISLTLLYGFRVWSPLTTSIVLSGVALATGASITTDAFDGVQLWGELFEVPLMSAMFLAMVWHARRRKAALEVASALAEQQAAVLVQEERLLHDVSHELRTPVTITRLHLELLERELGEQPRPLTIAFDELDRIESIVERLLLLARVEGSGLVTNPVALLPFLEDVFMRWVDLAPRAWQLGAIADVTVTADEMLLRTAIDALLENAVHYTDDYARIALSAPLDGNEVVITVSDDGVGIEEEARERIFERFARSDESRSRRAGGVGLGLATVLAIARAHDGSCRLGESTSGAVFELRLPVSQTAYAETARSSAALSQPASA